MAYKRIKWKDRVLVLNEDGTINKVIQEGTPVSAFNLNHMEDGIVKTYYDTELIKKNQLELLISRDLEGQRVSMDEGYWFDSLKNENKIQSKTNMVISNNILGISDTNNTGDIEFKPHEIGFKTNKTTYYHKRKSGYTLFKSLSNKNANDTEIDVIAETITITY